MCLSFIKQSCFMNKLITGFTQYPVVCITEEYLFLSFFAKILQILKLECSTKVRSTLTQLEEEEVFIHYTVCKAKVLMGRK